jgi:RND family efflux transporter MFP subunit
MKPHTRYDQDPANKKIAKGGITDKDLKAADIAQKDAQAQTALSLAQLDQARAALEIARKRLRNTVIRAPVSGEIQKKFINPGAYVEAPTAVLTIVDNLRLELETLVPAANLAAIRSGQRVAFSINSYPGQEFEGRVIEVSPAVESDTRSAKVRIQVDNRGRKLKDGMFAEGRILTGVTTQTLLVPAAAVYRDDRSAKLFYVFVVENGKAVRRTVRVGNETDSSLEIVEGLKAGDQLIAEQSIELADGVPIRAASEETRR